MSHNLHVEYISLEQCNLPQHLVLLEEDGLLVNEKEDALLVQEHVLLRQEHVRSFLYKTCAI